jgi:integrase
MMRERVKKFPTGPLFQTREGNPWGTLQLCHRFRVIRKEVGLPRLTPYTYRHTFATNWLKAGKWSIDMLAELLGNTPSIIRKHYSHLCADNQNIRSQLEAFKRLEEEIGTP